MSHYDKQQVDILMLIVIIGAMLSLCGSLFIMISSVLLAKVKEIYWRLVFGLATSDLLMIAFGMITIVRYWSSGKAITGPLCDFQAVMVNYFALASAFYVLFIAAYLYITVARNKQVSRRMEVAFHVCVWVLAAIPTAFSAFRVDGTYHLDVGVWCRIVGREYAPYVYFYAWVWGVIVAIFIFYTMIIFQWRKDMMNEPKYLPLTLVATGKVMDMQKSIPFRFFLYPVAYIILWTPSTISRIDQELHNYTFAFALVEVLCVPLQGFINAIIYISTGEIVSLKAMWNCLKKRRTLQEASRTNTAKDIILDEGAATINS